MSHLKKKRYSDSLRAGRFRDRIPVGAGFSAPIQTGSGAQPASCTMGIGSFPGVKRPGRGVDHPPLYTAEVKERVELYLYSPSGSSWPVVGWTLPLPYLRPIYLTVHNTTYYKLQKHTYMQILGSCNGYLDFLDSGSKAGTCRTQNHLVVGHDFGTLD